jgi:hypothetical protein
MARKVTISRGTAVSGGLVETSSMGVMALFRGGAYKKPPLQAMATLLEPQSAEISYCEQATPLHSLAHLISSF